MRLNGPPSAPPVVLLPGIGSTSLTFACNVAGLSARCATYAVDNIHDHGLSVETKAVTSADDYAQWLTEVMEGLNLGSAVNLVGLSYGGWVAAQYALRFPKRTRRLVLLAPAGTVAPLPWAFIWRAVLCALPAKVFMRGFVEWIAPELGRDEAGRALRETMVEDGVLAQRSFKSRRMVPPLPLSDSDWSSLQVPTLLMAGDAEVIFSAQQSLARVAALCPSVTTRLFPGAGHDFFVTRASEVNQALLDFVSRD